jgi:hypothetical protein
MMNVPASGWDDVVGRTIFVSIAVTAVFELPGEADAQVSRGNAVVQGSVWDHDSRSPIQGASVTLTAADTEDASLGPLLTNEEGHFVFREVPPGTYVLQATMLGFQPRQDTLALGGATEGLGRAPAGAERVHLGVGRPNNLRGGGGAFAANGLQGEAGLMGSPSRIHSISRFPLCASERAVLTHALRAIRVDPVVAFHT